MMTSNWQSPAMIVRWRPVTLLIIAVLFALGSLRAEDDVENAAWHFLCVARLSGLAKARASLLPITNDSRVPMMQIYALFAGKAKPDDVLAAAKAGTPTAAQLRRQLFYANLYLGLYYEA